jgi:hypothetical protein
MPRTGTRAYGVLESGSRGERPEMHPTMTVMIAEDIQREHMRAASRDRLARAVGHLGRPHAPVSHGEPREGARRVLARWAWLR